MTKKKPSSLDYVSLLHELTLTRWMSSIAQKEWHQAQVAARRLVESSDRLWSWVGFTKEAVTFLLCGQSQRALQSLEKGAQAYPEARSLVASMRNTAAAVLLETGRLEAAIQQAERALEQTPSGPVGVHASFLRGMARLRQGERQDSRTMTRALPDQEGPLPTSVYRHCLKAEEVGLDGDARAAARELESACSSVAIPPAWLLFALAKFQFEADQPGDAERSLVRLLADNTAQLDWPIAHVRSHYYLALVHERRGDSSTSGEYYRRFVRFWEHGDIDREQVEQAKANLARFG